MLYRNYVIRNVIRKLSQFHTFKKVYIIIILKSYYWNQFILDLKIIFGQDFREIWSWIISYQYTLC